MHRLLIFLKLLSDLMSQLEYTHPGCLVASFTYESQQFHRSIRDSMKSGLIIWRNMIVDQLNAINQQYDAQTDISMETLADMFTGIIEGGILLARAFEDNRLLVSRYLPTAHFCVCCTERNSRTRVYLLFRHAVLSRNG